MMGQLPEETKIMYIDEYALSVVIRKTPDFYMIHFDAFPYLSVSCSNVLNGLLHLKNLFIRTREFVFNDILEQFGIEKAP